MFYFFYKIDDEVGYVDVGHTSPLWCCKNCMKPNEECVYCRCNECHFKIGSKKRKRGNDDEDKCDHVTLTVFTDSLYFTTHYLKKCKSSNQYTPTKCSECHKKLRSKNNQCDGYLYIFA